MKIIYSNDHRGHAGGKELIDNRLVPQFEKPARMDMILDRLRETGFGTLKEPERFGLEPLLKVHDPGYVAFLSEAYAQWHADKKDADDFALPFVAGTWQAVRSSAGVALTGQRLVAADERAAFALCRPPGHHAARDLAGGYCYVNNAAVAAQAFRDGGAARVAILDVDYHHGNGTQDIFYTRADVLFVSLHGDPEQEYPYFAGYADERGAGDGEGHNLNYPMPWGTAWERYGEALADGLAKIRAFGPDVLVVSLGVDTFKDDPISQFKLEHEDYLRLGEMIAGLGLPTLFVMEGGYAVEAIGVNVVNTLSGFEQAA